MNGWVVATADRLESVKHGENHELRLVSEKLQTNLKMKHTYIDALSLKKSISHAPQLSPFFYSKYLNNMHSIHHIINVRGICRCAVYTHKLSH